MRYGQLALAAASVVASVVLAAFEKPQWWWFLCVGLFLAVVSADMEKDN